MAERRSIWSVNSKKDAVLWLWESHNEVNDRLKADETEDPEFPKIQFPSKEAVLFERTNVFTYYQ